MLDIHPEPEHARVQVWTQNRAHDLGSLDATAIIEDTLAGRAVVDALIQEGLFVRDRQVVFEHVVHLSDVDTWLAYRAERGSRTILDPLIVKKAREILAGAEGEIQITERGYAVRLVRREQH